jgi:probable O-glycosylation ligase (exosortase A-associated)
MVIIGIFCTYSRGALVGLVLVMLLMCMQLKQRLILLPVIMIALTVAVLFAPESWQKRMNLTKKETALDQSAYSRINAWTFSWHLAKEYPLAGGGFDTFTKELFVRYAPNAMDVHGPHSVYFGVLAEHGFIGLALYLTLVGSCFASLRRIAKAARSYGDETASHYALALQFSLIGFLVSGIFLGRAYFDYYFAIVCLIIMLKKICFTSWRTEERLVTGEPLEPEDEDEEYAELGYAH